MSKKIVAPCGIDCFNCELLDQNVTEPLQQRLGQAFHVSPERITCQGCAEGHQCLLLDLQGKKCKTLTCIEEKGVDYCFECEDFPCDYLLPLADGAEKFPHNMKLFNLCTMKRIGVEAWAEQASDIRKTYFAKKMSIGEGGSKG